MAYPPVGMFQGIPALYNLPHPKLHKRRTATNIMAGYFDHQTTFSFDFPRYSDTSSSASSPSVDEPVPHMSTPHQRDIRKLLPKKRKFSPAKRVRNTASASATPVDSKRKKVKAVSTEGKENTVSDGNSRVRAIPHATPSSSSMPNMPSSLKRKRSLDPTDDAQTNDDSTKKARLSEAAAAVPAAADILEDGGSRATPAPSPASQPSPSSPTPSIKQLLSDVKALDTPGKRRKAGAPKLYELTKTGVYCKLCSKNCVKVGLVEPHLLSAHRKVMNNLRQPERKPIVKKNVAIKKGWKGWVEADLAPPKPQKLIMLDEPEILPNRTTRSGRKIT